ncbi:purine phosphorylase [Candidatus Nitrosacidococcus sp. I8]|uniref:phosphorylase family protein n=1 Tax=Candidatus Nitrosacidococcus sp. I8 TaxID=2942908 RepID=UPI002227586E|nr:purine phosphorylase [Candidatus Nitrosacidococcus sp. I8]CAH9017816.1 5'-methylthioadenosine/S-adenosylhomocysteine nucleosidase [Candidatus Nitrosacidococcus sp. I8]
MLVASDLTHDPIEAEILAIAPIDTGIIAALPSEGRCLTKKNLYPKESIHLSESLYLQLSGMGSERAQLAAESFVAAGAKALISWGVAGGLAPHIKSGTLLLPKQIRVTEDEIYHTDHEWRQRIINRLDSRLTFSIDALHHTEITLGCPETKNLIYHQTQCVATDMESAPIASVAAKAGIPFLVIRSVVDPAHMALPNSILSTVNMEGNIRKLALLANLLKCPKDILKLWQLATHFHAARTTLRTVVACIGPALLAV